MTGTALGAAAGALGGWTDRLAMRAVNTLSSITHLLLGSSPTGCRPRGSSAPRCCRCAPASRLRVIVRDLVPAVLPQAGLAAGLMVPDAMRHESALSFLGLGPPAHRRLVAHPFPGLFLVVPTLAPQAWRAPDASACPPAAVRS